MNKHNIEFYETWSASGHPGLKWNVNLSWHLAEEQTREDRMQSWTKLYDQVGTVLA